MNQQYDYESQWTELKQGIDITFKTILEPFIYDNISEYIQQSGNNIRIIDVGCGCGYLTDNIAKRFKNYNTEGIDISEAAIEFAKSKYNLKFSQCDVLDLDEDVNYDVIVYNMVLHNLKELEASIRKTSMMLKENGIVIITIPHPTFWLYDKVARGKIVLDEPFNYNRECFYRIPFKIKNGSTHKIELTYYHRRLATYVNTFSRYLTILKFEEVDCKNGFPTMLRVILKKEKSDQKPS